MGTKKLSTKKKPKLSKLSDKQRLFVEYYLADGEMNASLAARRAGYSGKNAAQQLFANPDVIAAINRSIAELSEKAKIEQFDVFQELCNFAFANLQDYMDEFGKWIPLHKLPPELATCVRSVSYDSEGVVTGYDLYDKIGPLQLVGRHLGMFQEKLQLEATGSLDTFLAAILERANGPAPVIDATSIKRIASESPGA